MKNDDYTYINQGDDSTYEKDDNSHVDTHENSENEKDSRDPPLGCFEKITLLLLLMGANAVFKAVFEYIQHNF